MHLLSQMWCYVPHPGREEEFGDREGTSFLCRGHARPLPTSGLEGQKAGVGSIPATTKPPEKNWGDLSVGCKVGRPTSDPRQTPG